MTRIIRIVLNRTCVTVVLIRIWIPPSRILPYIVLQPGIPDWLRTKWYRIILNSVNQRCPVVKQRIVCLYVTGPSWVMHAIQNCWFCSYFWVLADFFFCSLYTQTTSKFILEQVLRIRVAQLSYEFVRKRVLKRVYVREWIMYQCVSGLIWGFKPPPVYFSFSV